jgi:ribosomal protein S18 acetylase RimI-like enzyme
MLVQLEREPDTVSVCELEKPVVTLRNANLDDADAIEAVTRAAYELRAERIPPYKALSETAADVRRHLEHGGAVIAEFESAVVGAVRYREQRPGALLLYRFAVAPGHQRHGIGRRLMAEVERIAHESGYDEVHLHARRTCPDLIAAYERLGYHGVDDPTEPDYNHPVYLLMSKTV